MKTFKEKVLSVVAKIPQGKVMTYKFVATKAGNPQAARAVGMIMSQNKDKKIPCHRVIKSDGTMGGYNGLRGKDKKAILQYESRISRKA